MAQQEADFERIVLAEGVERVVHAVLAASDVDPGRQQFLDLGDAAAFRIIVKPALQHQIGGGIGDHVDVGLAQPADDVIGVIPGIARQRAGMAGGDPALPAIGDGQFGDDFQRARLGIVGLVDMHVDVGIELPGDVEHDLDMPPAVPRRGLVERHAADDIDAKFHHLAHQRLGAGRFDDAFLRKGDDLNLHQIAKPLAGADQAFGRAGAADRIDIDMGAQPGNPVLQRLRQHP